MKTKNTYPEIDELLINKLKKDFPNKLPKKEISAYELGFLIGQQSIISKLEYEMNEQNETDTEIEEE